LALGAEQGQSATWWQKNQWGGSSLWEPTDLRREQAERIAIEIETLDRVMAHVALHDDLLNKLDVEGYELEVMRGGRDTLGRARALIVELPLVEANHRPRFAEVVEFLDDLGFLYRGNLACAWVDGIPRLADAVFCKRVASLSAA